MSNNGVMVVTSKSMFGRYALTDRASKNNSFASIGGATLRDMGIRTNVMPQYLLEEIGRCVGAGTDLTDVGSVLNSRDSFRHKTNYIKAFRLNNEPTMDDLKHTFKVSIPQEMYARLRIRAMMRGMSISRLLEAQISFIEKMEEEEEVTSNKKEA